MHSNILSQEEIMQLMIPELQLNGASYRKVKSVLARKAKKGERIYTITSDGLETTNIATEECYVIKSLTEAGEMYIINEQKFQDRYEFDKKTTSEFSIYKAKGVIIALELTPVVLSKLNLTEEFLFIAAWKEPMVAKSGDFLATSLDYAEIYRIARKEFFETYQSI